MEQQKGTLEFVPHKLRFNLTPEQIEETANSLIEAHKKFEDELVKIPIENWNSNTLISIFDASMDFQTQYASCYFPIYVSSDKELKDKATQMKNKIDAYSVESSMREDVFNVLKQFQEKVNQSPEKYKLTEGEQRWLKKEIIEYKRNGLDLPKEQKERMSQIKKKMSELKTSFSNNLNDDKTKHAFTLEELKGMPSDYLEKLEKSEDGKYFVTLKYPDIIPLMEKCQVEATRKQMDFLNGNKGGQENVQMFSEVLELRKEQAKLLGYKNFSDFALELRMAKKTETVISFISELREKLKPYAEKELQTMIELKQKYCQENQMSFDGKINSWDFGFFNNLLLDTQYKLDNDKIKEYFPIERVTEGMFQIYQKILGLRFEVLKEFPTWHPDVTSYAVYDAKSNEFMGQFYLDMHPREGKYGHACVIGTQRCGVRVDGSRQYPCCVMLCNFNKPTKEKPSLINHGEVETFFHEFGHVMHNICSEASIYGFSCTLVERDFVEAPSQMLENWTYEEEPLNLMSGHYQDQSKKLPKEILDSIVAAKNVNTGLLNLRQLFFGTFDMTVHTSEEKINTQELWAKLRKEVTLLDQQPGTDPSGGFNHLMGGYESGYYGYMWSQVYSADMYEGGFKGDPLSEEYGMKYRKCILAPGGTKDGIDLLIDFLGREPQQEAFLRSIGVEGGQDKPKL